MVGRALVGLCVWGVTGLGAGPIVGWALVGLCVRGVTGLGVGPIVGCALDGLCVLGVTGLGVGPIVGCALVGLCVRRVGGRVGCSVALDAVGLCVLSSLSSTSWPPLTAVGTSSRGPLLTQFTSWAQVHICLVESYSILLPSQSNDRMDMPDTQTWYPVQSTVAS